jgi:ATP-binding protein involved in chromosome partitioning
MAITKDRIFEQLRTVNDPQLHRDLVTLGMVKGVAVCDGMVSVKVELSPPAAGSDAYRQQISRDVKAAVTALGEDVKQVAVDFAVAGAASGGRPAPAPAPHPSAGQPAGGQPGGSQAQAAADNPLPGVRHIVAVGAGKGGVGKSTVAVNLAVALARTGAAVGLLDGDIYGPSLPTMLGLDGMKPRATPDNHLIPFEVHGLKAMTLGALVEQEKPLIWRGPMAHGAFRQLATQTAWGELDYLIIDLPPGTGDVPLTMSQLLPLTGAVVVCTPQKVAQDDARRAVRMFEQLNIEVLGIVENMSYFIGDDGKEYDIFGRGGAELMAQQMGKPFLGAVPINMALRHNCDAGDPTANFEDGAALASELEAVARCLAGQVAITAADREAAQPTISIH